MIRFCFQTDFLLKHRLFIGYCRGLGENQDSEPSVKPIIDVSQQTISFYRVCDTSQRTGYNVCTLNKAIVEGYCRSLGESQDLE